MVENSTKTPPQTTFHFLRKSFKLGLSYDNPRRCKTAQSRRTAATGTTGTADDSRSIRGRYAARILREFLTERYLKRYPRDGDNDIPSGSLPSWSIPAVDDLDRMSKQDPPLPEGKVCIIGAGIAGLYLAMLLDHAKIPYEILEASSRIGGRIFTYEFPTNDPPVEHNYYDVGAMRFPHLKTMDP